jgi:hypothetical protein
MFGIIYKNIINMHKQHRCDNLMRRLFCAFKKINFVRDPQIPFLKLEIFKRNDSQETKYCLALLCLYRGDVLLARSYGSNDTI